MTRMVFARLWIIRQSDTESFWKNTSSTLFCCAPPQAFAAIRFTTPCCFVKSGEDREYYAAAEMVNQERVTIRTFSSSSLQCSPQEEAGLRACYVSSAWSAAETPSLVR